MRDQRGAVLPLVMLILLVLSVALIGLSTLTGQEPLIASNHVMAVQAQALAEAGLERALWALSTPESSNGIPWSVPAAAPYDGSGFISMATELGTALGGFRLTISGEGDRQRQVVAVGLVPGDSGPLGRARQEISATVIRLRFPSPPAGLAVRGNLEIGAGVSVDASADGACGDRAGTWSAGATVVGAGAQVQGRSGDPAIPNEATDVQQQQAAGVFDELGFSVAELQALKAVARVRGTYYQGAVTFDASRRIPDGLIFVDTVSGQPISDSTPAADLATVSIGEGAATGPSGSFRGWVVVNGSLSVAGSITLQGFVYAADRLSQTSTARLLGAAMAGHVRSTAPSRVDAHPANGAALAWSCESGRTGGGKIPQRWIVKPGSYREAAG
ncbi:MAG: pilus assembly PilX N-terminal domain-containing protein [Candidatus Rokuibacteriota bacterium]